MPRIYGRSKREGAFRIRRYETFKKRFAFIRFRQKKRETGWNRAYTRFYLIHQATEMEHNSRPTERMVSNIASIRSAEGFLVPLTYWANRLCDIPNLRAMAEALSSGCAINTSYKGLVGFFMKNPSKLRSSSISSQWIPSSLSVKLFRCSGVANGCHFL